VPAQQWVVYLDAMEVGCGGIGRVWKWLWKDKWDRFKRKVVMWEKNDENTSDKDDSIACQTDEQKMKWHGHLRVCQKKMNWTASDSGMEMLDIKVVSDVVDGLRW